MYDEIVALLATTASVKKIARKCEDFGSDLTYSTNKGIISGCATVVRAWYVLLRGFVCFFHIILLHNPRLMD